MMDGVESAIFMSVLLKELHPQLKTSQYTDTENKSLHDALWSRKYISDKRPRIDIVALKEMLHKKEIDKIHWVKKEHQLADSLTKIGGTVSPLINTLIYRKLHDPE